MTDARIRTFAATVCAVVIGFVVQTAESIVFHGTGDANHNTTAPTGTYADSGWQWQGDWSLGSGTPISAKHFITAKHFWPSAGTKFVYDGVQYEVEDGYDDDPSSDLRIVEIQGVFPEWAPLYTGSDEIDLEAVLLGRGYSRGSEVTIGGESKGWLWDSGGQGTRRWGTNTVSGTADGGVLLTFTFDAGAGGDECTLAIWDSGGGVFIKDGDTWKLAGMNYSVDGPFDEDGDDEDSFDASLFDKGGAWEKTSGTWTYNSDGEEDIPGLLYATRISDRIAWIHGVIPEPATLSVLALGALALLRPRRRRV